MITHPRGDFLAFIHGPDGFLRDVLAANNLITLTAMVAAQRDRGETVKFNRERTS